MKKLIIAILSVVTFGVSGTAVANSAPSPETNSRGSLATETVNDIAVPTEVLIYVQTNYQGYAVTQATKTSRDGKPAYSLRVDPNDVTTDYDGFYLLYDTNWKLLGQEKMAPPAQKPQTQEPKSSSSASDQKHTTKPKHRR